MLSFSGLSQSITETRWYFGNSAENLLFDFTGREVQVQQDQFIPFGSAGSVTITDQFTGNLLFYADGENIYDASHNTLPSQTLALSGNNGINVPIVTCPVPGEERQYYLFTNSGASGVNEIQYSVVDADSVGNGSSLFPSGDITSIVNVSTGLVNPAEGMIMIPQGDGETFWLITQNRVSFDITVSEITNGGIATAIVYSNFVDGGNPGFEAAHFAFHRDGGQLAIAPKTANRNIWLMSFNPLTANMTLDSVVTGTGFDDGANEAIYDLEWSPNGTKLYLSRFGGTGTAGQLYQLDLIDSTSTGRIEPVLSNPVFRSYGLQKAIDDRIYHLYQETNSASPFTLGRINRPDSLVDSVQYQSVVFGQNFNARQFPQFTGGYNFTYDTLGFYWIDSCATNVTKFFPIVDPVPNTLSWNFTEGLSDQWIPNFTFSAEGSYVVTLTAEVAGVERSIPRLVNILPNDLMVDLGNDTTICIDEVLTLDAGMGTSYVWSTGETTQRIDVDTTGTYWVEVTNATGCTDFDDISVLEYGVEEEVFNQWYFGERAGIDFNTELAILDANNQMAEEGCATISDINGDLLFYTNGQTVWNRLHEVMLNGDSVGGDVESAQNSLIMPFGGDQTLFYLFTTEQVYGDSTYSLRYSMIDMKEDESLGKVIIKNIKLMENSTERITGSGFTGNDLIVAHEFGNNFFKTFSTSQEGLSGAVFAPSGEIHDFMNELSATGYMKIAPTFDLIAVLIPGTNQVEILDFDEGEVSNPRLIDTGESDLYGLEFSPDARKLYLSTSAASSKLIQYDLDSLNSENPVADIEATKFDAYQQGANYGALQTGPNGTIYLARDNSGTIGTISAPNEDDAASSFDQEGFDLQGRISRLGLPNFAQRENTPAVEPSITVTPGCVGQESAFTAVGRDPNNSIESYLWIFGDGFSAPVQDTTHIYEEAGTYTVQMLLSNRCDEDTILTTTITVENLPESPSVPTDTALCDQPIVLEAWPVDNPNFTYQWSTGDSTRQITVSEGAIIGVSIIDIVTGCPSETDTIVVGDVRPGIDLGPDRIFCQNDPPETLDALIENASLYEWTIDGVISGTERTLEVDKSVSGDFEYILRVENRFGCVGRDTLLITIQEAPDVSLVGNPTSGCGNDDGFLEVTFNTTGSYVYEISGTEDQGPFNFDGPGNVSIPSTNPGDSLMPGNYQLSITNLITGCSRTESFQIEDPGTFNLMATSTGNCDGDVEVTLTNVPASFSYEVIQSDGTVISGTNSQSVFSGLLTGVISVSVTDNNAPNCTETELLDIPQLPSSSFTFNSPQRICGNEGVIFVNDGTSGSATYTWSGPGIIGSNTGDTIRVSRVSALDTYSVTAEGNPTTLCPATEEIVVEFNMDPEASIEQLGDPCDGELTLVANTQNGDGPFLYSWSDGTQTQQNEVSVSGTYSVTVEDQFTGCISTTSVDVVVEEEFTVDLALEPDCENNGQVLVVASTNIFDPAITYEWQDESGNVLASTDSILSVSVSGTYAVIASNPSGTCRISDEVSVQVVPINPEDLLLPENASFCRIDAENATATLNPGIFNTYEWQFLPDPAIVFTNQIFQVSEAGSYQVRLYNGFTCLTDQVQVVEDCRPVVIAPNAFSPNGNDRNEEFFVFPNDFVEDFEIQIYTRWGELVFRSLDQNFRWDGIYRGQPLPPGTYAYLMRFSSSLSPALGTIEQYGSVTLIR